MTPRHHLSGRESIMVTQFDLVMFNHIFHFEVDHNFSSNYDTDTPLCIRQDMMNILMHFEGRDDLTERTKSDVQ